LNLSNFNGESNTVSLLVLVVTYNFLRYSCRNKSIFDKKERRFVTTKLITCFGTFSAIM